MKINKSSKYLRAFLLNLSVSYFTIVSFTLKEPLNESLPKEFDSYSFRMLAKWSNVEFKTKVVTCENILVPLETKIFIDIGASTPFIRWCSCHTFE